MIAIWEGIFEDLCNVKANIELELHQVELNDVTIHQAKPGAVWFSDKYGKKCFYSGNYLVEIIETKTPGIFILKEDNNGADDSVDATIALSRNSQN